MKNEKDALRLENKELEKKKSEMEEEAITMRNKGIEIQTQIEEGQATIRNIENFTAETETVIEDSQKEVV